MRVSLGDKKEQVEHDTDRLKAHCGVAVVLHSLATHPTGNRKVNRKTYHACLRIILSQLLREERLHIISEIYDGEPKTRQLLNWFESLGLEGSALIVIEKEQPNLSLATRNLSGLDVCTYQEATPVRLIDYQNVYPE